MILTVTPNPAFEKTVFIAELRPGEDHRAKDYTVAAGGKGCNVARAVRCLGGEARAIVLAGGPTGEQVVATLREQDGVEVAPVWTRGMTRTITTVREPKGRQTAFFEPGPAITEAEHQALLATVARELPRAQALTLSGSVPDTSLNGLYASCIQLARAAGVPVLLDSYGAPFAEGLRARPDVAKGNTAEVGSYTQKQIQTNADIAATAYMLSKLAHTAAIITKDTHGYWYVTPLGGVHVSALPIEAVNAVGSGDAVLAAWAMGLAGDWPFEQTARLAAAAGAANAEQLGLCQFTRARVDELAAQVRLTPYDV